MELIEVLQQIIQQSMGAAGLSDLQIGTVTSASPLEITVDTLMLCYCEEKRTGPEVTKPTQQPAQVELPPPNTVSAASPQPVPVAVGVVPVVAAGVVTPEMVAAPPS